VHVTILFQGKTLSQDAAAPKTFPPSRTLKFQEKTHRSSPQA